MAQGESTCTIFHAFPAGQVIFCPTTKYKRKGFQKSSHILHTVVLILYTILLFLNKPAQAAAFRPYNPKNSPQITGESSFFLLFIFISVQAEVLLSPHSLLTQELRHQRQCDNRKNCGNKGIFRCSLLIIAVKVCKGGQRRRRRCPHQHHQYAKCQPLMKVPQMSFVMMGIIISVRKLKI